MPKNVKSAPGWWQGRFRGCGYRVTIAREAILEVLQNTKGHLSVEDIFQKIPRRYSHIGLTTIYRTLNVLCGLGIVSQLDCGDDRARYELVEDPKGPRHHHHHLICTSCNAAFDYTDFIDEEIKLLEETEKGLSKKYNFKISNHQIQFYGLCATCGANGQG